MVDITNIDVSNLGTVGSTISAAGDWLLNIGMIIGIVAVVAIIFYFVWREFQYKIPVSLYRIVSGNKFIEVSDRAWINKRKGEIKLKKSKVVQSIPANNFFVKTLKGWKLHGQWDGYKAVQWQELSFNSPLSFNSDQYDVFTQMGHRVKNAAIRHSELSFWDKYGSPIMMMSTVLVIAVIFIVLFDSVGNLGPSIQAGLQAWGEAVKEASSNVGVQQIAGASGG